MITLSTPSRNSGIVSRISRVGDRLMHLYLVPAIHDLKGVHQGRGSCRLPRNVRRA